MSRAICDGCGKDSRISMAITTDDEVHSFLGDRNYCVICGSYLAGVITWMQRTAFKWTSAPVGEGGES